MAEERYDHRTVRPPGLPGRAGRGHGGGPGAMLGMPPEKAKDFKGTLKRLAAYLRPRSGRLILAGIAALLTTSFTIAAPKIMGLGITELFRAVLLERGQGGVDFVLLGRVIAALGALYIGSSLFSYLLNYLMAGIAQETAYDLRTEVFTKLHRLPIAWFDKHSHGDILSRVTNDLDVVSSTLQQGLAELLNAGIIMTGVIIMMLIISPLLTAASILILPLSLITTRTIAKTSQRFFVRQQKVLGTLNGHVEEMISGHVVVKAFGGEERSLQVFEESNRELYNLGWKANFISGLIMPLMHIVNNLGYIVVAVAGGVMVAKGSLPLGDIQAFIQYSKQFGQPIVQISQIINIVQSTIAAAERVFEVLDEKEQSPDPPEASLPDPLKGEISLRNISFSYSQEKPLIEDLNLEVKPGQAVAIVGPTGAGKTTLVNLLMRFYETDKGTILVDRKDTKSLGREQLRSVFSMVLQDTWLFKGTLKENIAYGHEGATDEEIYRAAEAAQADHFIRTLPDGYNTVLNEEGSNISEGERQLITIARAFLADPPILILDEATSSVDTRTEVLIQKAMRELLKGRTSFIIAHRLSTIRKADIILVMNNGEIVEQGSHQELLERGGFYAELYKSQFL